MSENKQRILIFRKIKQSDTIKEIIAKQPLKGLWSNIFLKNIKELESISNILAEDEKINGCFYPLKKDIFKAFHLTPFEKVKVVILGQDPYPQTKIDGTPRAQGLSFSVDVNDSIPSSLINIFKELQQNYPEIKPPSSGDLTSWARQGVFLLNTCLTVRPGIPESHKDIWKALIVSILEELSIYNNNIVYVLWGRKAMSYTSYIKGNPLILDAPHPSGRSAYLGFFGCNHFKKINEHLMKKNIEAINWEIS